MNLATLDPSSLPDAFALLARAVEVELEDVDHWEITWEYTALRMPNIATSVKEASWGAVKIKKR